MKRQVWGWITLAAALLLGACASEPLPPENLPPNLVTRTADSTVWSTPEAAAAAAAAAKAGAAARTAPGRTPPAGAARTGGGGQRAVAAPGAAASGASAAAGGPAAPSALTAAADAAPPARLIYFDFDSYDIKGEFNAAIEGHARQLMADRGLRLVIEGHADERGGAEYNLALGQKRAQAVVKALRLLGVNEAQVEAVSFGDTRPAARGQNEEAWAQNRRAEFKDR